MKRIFTLIAAALFLSVGAFSQGNTMVLVEEGTNASCGPCASQNPAFDALLAANDDIVVVLKYQWWFPGTDPMHDDNPAEANGRFETYYGQNGVPTGFINGEVIVNDCNAYPGAPACVSQADLDAAHAIVSPLSMSVSAEVVNGLLQVSGTITADQAISGDLKLRMALAEQTVSWSSAPGSNGETTFHHVMKSFIGGMAGIDLADMAMGEEYTISESMPLAGLNIYDFTELEVVAFVQDDADKTIHQAAKDQSVEITSEYNNSAAGAEITGLPNSMCVGPTTISPAFRIVNQGNSELTSAIITYSINGGADQMMDWSGSLATLAFEDVALDPYTFDAMSTNTITGTVSMPNGVADEDVISENNTVETEFIAADAGESIEIEILTDNYGSETTWTLKDEMGATVLSGGPYTDGVNETFIETYTIPAGAGCYEFEIFDSYGDGICCGYGIGHYILRDANGNVLIEGGEFGDDTSENASMSASVGISENELAAAIKVGPNPVNDILNVNLNMDSDQDNVTLEMLNALGQVVFTQNLGRINGLSLTEINVKNFEAGIYHVNVISGTATSTTKVSVIR